MTFHGMGALNATAQVMQTAADSECSAWHIGQTIDASQAQYLAGCFIETPPPGVPADVHYRFCLRAVQCGAFSRPGDLSVDAYLFQNAPIADCLSDDQIAVIQYWRAHGTAGPDKSMNMLGWLATRAEQYWDRLTMQTPPCPAPCVDKFGGGLISSCLASTGSSSPCVRSNAVKAWFQGNVDKPLCNVFGAEVSTGMSQMGCGDLGPMLDYCEAYGHEGPDPARNVACWALRASSSLPAARARCPAPAPAPLPTAPAPTYAPPPVTADTPTSLPTLPSADMTSFPTETGPSPVFEPGSVLTDTPPPRRMKTSTMVTIGLVAAAGIAGAVFIAKRGKR